jgi:hypothetical protein
MATETEHPGYLGSQDTYYVGLFKGIARFYQPTFMDTYTRVSCAKFYDITLRKKIYHSLGA